MNDNFQSLKIRVSVVFFSILACTLPCLILFLLHFTAKTATAYSSVPEIQFDSFFDFFENQPLQVTDIAYDDQANMYQLILIRNQDGAVVDLDTTSGVDAVIIEGDEVLAVSKFTKDGVYLGSKILFYVSNGTGSIRFRELQVHALANRIAIRAETRTSQVEIVTNAGVVSFTNNATNSQNIAALVAVLDQNLNYLEHAEYADAAVIDVTEDSAQNALYLAGHLYTDVDIDAFTNGTEIATKSGNTDEESYNSFVARYSNDYAVDHFFTWGAEEQVTLEAIDFKNGALYVGVEYNSSGSELYDVDPTDGVKSVSLHEHDPVIQKFSSDGEFIWSFEQSSQPLVGEYSVDDEYLTSMAVSDSGEVFFSFFSDGEAVQVGEEVFEVTVTQLNNYGESIVLKLSADGQIVWVEKLQGLSGTSYSRIDSLIYEPDNDMLIVPVLAYDTGFEYDQQQIYTHFVTEDYNVQPIFMFVDDGTGQYLASGQTDLLAGTATEPVFEAMEVLLQDRDVDLYRLPNQSNEDAVFFTVRLTVFGTEPLFDLDWTENVVPHAPVGFDRLFVTHKLQYDKSVFPNFAQSSSNTDSCAAPKPGLKDPMLFGAEPVSKDSIRIYIAPGDQPFTHYNLVYGTESDSYQYGALNISAPSDKVTTFDVSFLKPNTNYYFRIVAMNDCASSNFSNEVSARTQSIF